MLRVVAIAAARARLSNCKACAFPRQHACGSLPQNAGFATATNGDGEGPVTVVFGATGGIGAALAHRLHALRSNSGTSAQVPSALILSADKVDRLKDLQQALRGVDIVPADARNPSSVEQVVQQVLSRHGRLDAVVNCIGSVAARSTLATDLEALHETLDVNLVTSFNIVKAAIKGMLREDGQHQTGSSSSSDTSRQGGGSIVLVSAAVASHGIPNYEAMSAAKAAVEGLARSAAATYSHHNIRVNCVAPGLTRTPQTRRFTENENVSNASKEMHPLKKLAQPEQVAAALEFFIRPENNFITGQVLAVDGGLSSLHPHHAEEYGMLVGK